MIKEYKCNRCGATRGGLNEVFVKDTPLAFSVKGVGDGFLLCDSCSKAYKENFKRFMCLCNPWDNCQIHKEPNSSDDRFPPASRLD